MIYTYMQNNFYNFLVYNIFQRINVKSFYSIILPENKYFNKKYTY